MSEKEGCSSDLSGKIIIAGCGFEPDSRPDDFSIFPGDDHIKQVKVTNFLDPGGFSFYESTSPEFIPKEDLVHVRKSKSGNVGLGGKGWTIPLLKQSLRLIVIHHDGSMNSASCYRTLLQRGYSTHFMIDWDGHIYQAADVADVTLHGNETNEVSVGIDMNNVATIIQPGTQMEIPQGRQISDPLKINGQEYISLTYKPAQYRSLVALLRVLRREMEIEQDFPIDENGMILTTVMTDPPPKAYSGIIFHWHIKEDKWDPGPGFDWKSVRAALQREQAALPAIPVNFQEVCPRVGVVAPLKTIPESELYSKVHEFFSSEDNAREVIHVISRAIEQWKVNEEGGGGYYPMGINQTWHNGIHIPVRPNTPVHPILAGEVVAAHLVPEEKFPSYGSNNFVLLRHKIELPPRDVKEVESSGDKEEQEVEVEKNILTVYSLYMHLSGVDLRKPPKEMESFCDRLRGKEEIKLRAQSFSGLLLESVPADKNQGVQYGEMIQGHVGLFSHEGGKLVKVGPRDVIGLSGWVGDPREDVLHIEVFADSSCLKAMELALYGDYLLLGVEEYDNDLMVRSDFILSMFTEEATIKHGERVLSEEMIKDMMRDEREEAERYREILRRMIVRHMSEWSDKVDWVQALINVKGSSDWWKGKVEKIQESKGVFSKEIKDYLGFIWLDDTVARHIGINWDEHPGVLYFFNPLYFVLWWMFRRSAVRGEGVAALLNRISGRQKTSISKDISEFIQDYFLKGSDGQGEWEM